MSRLPRSLQVALRQISLFAVTSVMLLGFWSIPLPRYGRIVGYSMPNAREIFLWSGRPLI